MTRRWHQNKDIERILKEAERLGWRVESPPKGYFKMAPSMLMLGGSQVAMMFSVAIEAAAPSTGDRLEEILDGAMERLLAAGAQDPAIGAIGASGVFEITVTVQAPSLDVALADGLTLVREALANETTDWRAARATRVEPSSA